MAGNKLRGERGEIPRFNLDASARRDPSPTMTEILANGAPREVREFLGGQGALLRAGAPLPAPVAEWLGAALEAIGRGADANLALRLSTGKRGRHAKLSERELAHIERQIDDLVEQGVTRFDARGIVERYRDALRIRQAKVERLVADFVGQGMSRFDAMEAAEREIPEPDALSGRRGDRAFHEASSDRLLQEMKRSRKRT